jgi:hypothetical protein
MLTPRFSLPASGRLAAGALTVLLTGATLLTGPVRAANPTLESYAQASLKDLSAGIEVISKNDRELEKIGKGYTDAYTLTSQEISFKEPGLGRFQGKKGVLSVRRITTPRQQLFEVPLLRVRKVEDISKKPGKADTVADLGLITPGWADSVESKWLRAEQRDGKTLQGFDVWSKSDPLSRHTLWVDPTTKTVVEHLHFHRNPSKTGFRKRLVYSEVKQVNGVWVPTRVSLYNSENKLAATMRYDRVRVNTGLADSLFKI